MDLRISARTGLIPGGVSCSAAETSGGSGNVTVTAAADHGAAANQAFAWTVTHTNRAPSVTRPSDQTNHEGNAFDAFAYGLGDTAVACLPSTAGGANQLGVPARARR